MGMYAQLLRLKRIAVLATIIIIIVALALAEHRDHSQPFVGKSTRMYVICGVFCMPKERDSFGAL
jgi:hypothetical protein